MGFTLSCFPASETFLASNIGRGYICSIMDSPITKTAFLQYLYDNPNSRRVTQTGKDELIKLLTDLNPPPSSQKEFSRRNYVRKTFRWDENRRVLLAVAKKGEEQEREVITEDAIMDTVEKVHNGIGHAGWDASWKRISASYYGILRADVIFLLKLCRICATDPRKRPKHSIYLIPSSLPGNNTALYDLSIYNPAYQHATAAVLQGGDSIGYENTVSIDTSSHGSLDY